MWCLACHYGSEVCKLVPVGSVRTFVPSVDVEGKSSVKPVEGMQYKCPNCGTIDAKHLSKNPYKAKVYSGPKKKTKVRPSEKDQELKETVEAITGGDIQAMDYSKLG